MFQRAWGGEIRAARRAGQSPAAAPISMAAPIPPAQASADQAARNAAARETCLDHLEERAEGQGWQERFEHCVARFGPVLGFQQGPPAGHKAGSAT